MVPPPHPLYLAWLAEPVADGERLPRAPLHLTLVPPFAGDEDVVLDVVRGAVAGRLPVAAAAAETARLGPRRDVPVVLVAPHDGLRALHEALMDALLDAGVTSATPGTCATPSRRTSRCPAATPGRRRSRPASRWCWTTSRCCAVATGRW